MRSIPPKLRAELEVKPRMKICSIIADRVITAVCYGKIEWHHVWIYQGKQLNEAFGIVGACEKHHAAVKTSRIIKEAFERFSLEIATEDDLKKYPRKDWKQLMKYLGVIKK